MKKISSIMQKTIMSLTGIILMLFLFFHLIGNLGIYVGREAFNSYAELLNSYKGLLYIFRAGLFFNLILHIIIAFLLVKSNSLSKIIGYQKQIFLQTTIAANYMIYSGLLILFFVVFHIFHFTSGIIYPNYYLLIDSLGRHDVYSMVILSYQNLEISFIYLIAQIILFFHLSHGLPSIIQTLGGGNVKYNKQIKQFFYIFALIVCISYSSIPISVLFGILKIE